MQLQAAGRRPPWQRSAPRTLRPPPFPGRLRQMQRLQAREREDGTGGLVDVAMDQESFRDLISVFAD
jgi:hypothetical protein